MIIIKCLVISSILGGLLNGFTIGSMIDLNIKYQNYQQIKMVLKKEEEESDMSL